MGTTHTHSSAQAAGERSRRLRWANDTDERRNPMRTLMICSTILILAAVGTAGAEELKLDTEDQKTLYVLGLTISRSLSSFNLSPSELELVKAGLTDGSLHKTPKVDRETYGPKIKQLQEGRAASVAACRTQHRQALS